MNRTELHHLRDAAQRAQAAIPVRFQVCFSTPCLTSGAPAVRRALEEALAAGDRPGEVVVTGDRLPRPLQPRAAGYRPPGWRAGGDL